MRIALKPGDYFLHVHWLDANREPMVCKVTRVAEGCIYWRSYEGRDANGVEQLGGPPMFFTFEQADHYVAGYIDARCLDGGSPPTATPPASNGSLSVDPTRSDS